MVRYDSTLQWYIRIRQTMAQGVLDHVLKFAGNMFFTDKFISKSHVSLKVRKQYVPYRQDPFQVMSRSLEVESFYFEICQNHDMDFGNWAPGPSLHLHVNSECTYM